MKQRIAVILTAAIVFVAACDVPGLQRSTGALATPESPAQRELVSPAIPTIVGRATAVAPARPVAAGEGQQAHSRQAQVTATALPCISGGAVPNPQGNPGLVADCTALLAAKDALAGSATLNWHVDRVIADWEGIIIGGSPRRVTALDLAQRELTGVIPPELGTLANLSVLWLHNNRLAGPIPAELGTLANLEELLLANNALTGAIPPELGALINLRSLVLDNNALTGAIPLELGALANLEVLLLDNNALSGTIPAQIGALANLGRLALSNNQLTGSTPPELGALTSLEQLGLAGNELTGCVSLGLRGAARNDFDKLGLPFCGA